MIDSIAGFPFWEVGFDADGARTADGDRQMISELRSQNVTDLFVFAHGWNNDHTTARTLYDGIFREARKLVDGGLVEKSGSVKIATAGIFWPSIVWADELPQSQGGAARLAAPNVVITLEQLRTIFSGASDRDLAKVHDLLVSHPSDEEAIASFAEALHRLMSSAPAETSPEDSLERHALIDPAFRRAALEALAENEHAYQPEGGAAGIGDAFAKLWEGAKGALRVATYWQMRNRAGVVGRAGLGPWIDRLSHALPKLRIHLIGHSFGARLVSFSLAGLAPRQTSPVKSLLLLQGAFSHFTFADKLPFDGQRSGELKGMSNRVDGPLLATFSDYDLAVGRSYPLAAIVAGQDACDAPKSVGRWGAMGSDGAQAVRAKEIPLEAVGHRYQFEPGRWHNLDANAVIRAGDPPSGAHSDIVHPQVAWAALAAAGIT
jgi:hypothetical protein